MLEVAVVLLLVILGMFACLTWVCIKLIGDRLDSASISKLAQVYVNDMANGYVKGYNQKLTADAVPPTGPQVESGWDNLEQTAPHLHEEDDVEPDSETIT
jgi:hypothetical protein